MQQDQLFNDNILEVTEGDCPFASLNLGSNPGVTHKVKSFNHYIYISPHAIPDDYEM